MLIIYKFSSALRLCRSLTQLILTLRKQRLWQLTFALLIMLLSGLAELVSFAAVIPLLEAVNNPQVLWSFESVRYVSSRIGITSPSMLLIPVSILFAASSILAAIIRTYNLWLNGRLSALVGSDISCSVYSSCLHRSYHEHIRTNSSQTINAVVYQVQMTVNAITNVMNLILSCVVAVFITIGLLLVNWKIALSITISFGIFYLLISLPSSSQIKQNSLLISSLNEKQLRNLHEAFGSVRHVILDDKFKTYTSLYEKYDRPMRLLQTNSFFIAGYPRYALEAAGMVIIASVASFQYLTIGNTRELIPLLGTFALGAQRLMPTIQQAFASWCNILLCNASVEQVLQILKQEKRTHQYLMDTSQKPATPDFFSLELKNISFSYSLLHPESILSGINLRINKGDKIGIIGPTGSGKSTLLDVLMGLLEPTSGSVILNDQFVSHQDINHLRTWRSSISHVPQSVYLTDLSIAENIAFGITKNEIDYMRVYEAAKISNLHSFIDSLPEAYHTTVGEGGIRLSGGQKQRIAIARAIYKSAPILILDEATSALDTQTEYSVMEAIENLDKSITVIMVAHRLSTIQNCSRVYVIENGSIANQGTPNDIISLP